MNGKLLYWIWLAEACGPESSIPGRLYNKYENISTIYALTQKELSAVEEITEADIKALCDKDLYRAKHIADLCEQKGIGILTLDNSLYPNYLRRIQTPPPILYYRGYLPNFNKNLALAIVGTRSMNEEGRANAYRIAYELAATGVFIVSGMAQGIDGTAQIAALDAHGVSIAVLGTAIDRCYPSEHRPLYNRLLHEGCILSEYPPCRDTRPWHFPQRNRIISGLCKGTLVVQAGPKSGALITAQFAATQGRDLFAMPGDANQSLSVGTNALIKTGARAVTVTTDILSCYSSLYHVCIFPEHLNQPAYFRHYNDKMRYTGSAMSVSRAAAPTISAQPETPQKLYQDETILQSAVRYGQAPEDMTAREEPILSEETNAMREDAPYTPPAGKETEQPTPPPSSHRIEETAAAHSMDAALRNRINFPPPGDGTPEDKPSTILLSDSLAPEKENDEPDAENIPDFLKESGLSDASPLPDSELTEQQSCILEMLRQDMTFDEICAAGIPTSVLSSELTMLEISGYIVSTAGGRYCINH